jgi:hypothetical protein
VRLARPSHRALPVVVEQPDGTALVDFEQPSRFFADRPELDAAAMPARAITAAGLVRDKTTVGFVPVEGATLNDLGRN